MNAVVAKNIWNDKIEALEERLLKHLQADVPLEHFFAPGVYLRQVLMRKGTFVIGHCHKTRHANCVFSGRARVLMDGVVTEIVGPCVFNSEAGVRKVLYILEDMLWMTIHPTETTNLEQLEAELIEKSEPFLLHAKERQLLMSGGIQ